jgi:hypothetical protein
MDAEFYRAQARTVIALADGADDPTVQAELLDLAAWFMRLAEYADRFGTQYGPFFAPGWHH